MRTKITIADIAHKMGVSTSTVSRALKNNSSISENVKEKIWEEAKKMGYGRYLSMDEPRNIVIIVPEIYNYFYSKILDVIQKEINPKDFLVSIHCSYNSYENELMIVKKLDINQVCCVIISKSMDSQDSKHLISLQEQGVPLIMFNRVDYDVICPKFLIDNYMDSYKITNHLIKTGHKRIAFAAKHFNCSIYKERVQAYKDALASSHIDFDTNLLLYSELTQNDISEVIVRFLNTQPIPDALILPNYAAALEASHMAAMKNINIPEQLAIISFDEEPYSKFTLPAISGIERPHDKIGESIAALIKKIVLHHNYDKEKVVIFSSNFIIRNSSLNILQNKQ